MRLGFYLGLMVAFSLPAKATELVHHFESPSFGGNPLNGPVLLNQATAQNQFKDPNAVPYTPTPQKTPLQQFTDNLQSSILSQVSRGTSQNLFDKNGNLLLGTNLQFNGFSITVSNTPVNGTVSIDITDGISSTNLIVPYVTTTP
jgi:curli production assembly/transport component CsgF